MNTTRPRFSPSFGTVAPLDDPCLQSSGDAVDVWVPVVECPVEFSHESFESAVLQLIHHPEYNSTLILRSEIISDTSQDLGSSNALPQIDRFVPVRRIHRRLLARRPTRDASLTQHCTFFTPESELGSLQPPVTSLVVLTPDSAVGTPLPYYHPSVSHIAFRYLSSGKLRIEAVPLPGTDLDPGSRLSRTCLALLDTLHRYGWGAQTQYRKRVAHDRLVAREQYQDFYLQMRERHKHLVESWHESTDPLKHVFEDIAIATYLMLLWKETNSPGFHLPEKGASECEPWKRWPRPRGGFVDVGCGNGLLTHILVSEGYQGRGFDLRARTSWDHYPQLSRASLHIHSLDPTATSLDAELFPKGSFLIGNHADELTPWLPLLATRSCATGYISIPCCAFVFDARFERSKNAPFAIPGDEREFVEHLGLGADGSTSSSYATYRIWLASLSLYCGWDVECDTLRIPSTRNWAIIGRHRSGNEEAHARVDAIRRTVEQRGSFKARRPEGNAGDH